MALNIIGVKNKRDCEVIYSKLQNSGISNVNFIDCIHLSENPNEAEKVREIAFSSFGEIGLNIFLNDNKLVDWPFQHSDLFISRINIPEIISTHEIKGFFEPEDSEKKHLGVYFIETEGKLYPYKLIKLKSNEYLVSLSTLESQHFHFRNRDTNKLLKINESGKGFIAEKFKGYSSQVKVPCESLSKNFSHKRYEDILGSNVLQCIPENRIKRYEVACFKTNAERERIGFIDIFELNFNMLSTKLTVDEDPGFINDFMFEGSMYHKLVNDIRCNSALIGGNPIEVLGSSILSRNENLITISESIIMDSKRKIQAEKEALAIAELDKKKAEEDLEKSRDKYTDESYSKEFENIKNNVQFVNSIFRAGDVINIITSDINIYIPHEEKSYNIGKYLIKIDTASLIRTRGNVNRAITIKNISGYTYQGYNHPHVSSDTICWGGYHDSIEESILSMDIESLLATLLGFLSSYNQADPYIKFKYWYTFGNEYEDCNRYTCEYCDCGLDEEDYYTDNDGTIYCGDCFYDRNIICDGCGNTESTDYGHVLDHASYCEDCFSERYFYCEECETHEQISNMHEVKGNSYCRDCYDEISADCPECECRTTIEEAIEYEGNYFCDQSCLDSFKEEREEEAA